MWRRTAVKIIAVIAAAFVVASAAMFWVQFFGLKFRLGGGSVYDYSYDGSSYADSGDYVSAPTNQLKKLSPAEEWPLLDDISAALRLKTNAELFQLKAYDDVCAIRLVNCRGLPSAKIKPFIDATLSERQISETDRFARVSDLIAGGSLFVSLIALMFTALTYWGDRRSQRPSETSRPH